LFVKRLATLTTKEVVMGPTETIRALAEPLLTAAGLELWDVEVSRDRVRILVERPDGVDLEALTTASNALSPLFDEHDDLAPAGAYELEVSSPGVERGLRTPAQYSRYVGSRVSVKTLRAVDGSRRFQGLLGTAGDDSFELVADDGATMTIGYDAVERARTVLEWGPQPKPGGKAAPKAKKPAGAASAHETKDNAS
jgi:ribosome maturation factor RimP